MNIGVAKSHYVTKQLEVHMSIPCKRGILNKTRNANEKLSMFPIELTQFLPHDK